MTSGRDFGVGKELSLVEDRIRAAIQSDESLLTDIARYVIGAGGKRIRPTVALLANKAVGGKNLEQTVSLAAALELIHSATLLHDDINDDGATRRGRDAAYVKYGLQNALVTGDFLFVKAFAIGGTFDREIVELTAGVCTALAEAEIVQKRHAGNLSVTREDYLSVIRRKTALPLSAAARIGALLGGGTPEEVEALTIYGLNLGLAFQIVDDILDVVGDPAVLGKPVGTDLREGNVTLLVLHALNDGSERRAQLTDMLRLETRGEDTVARGLALIRESGAVERARVDADHYGFLAREALDGVRAGPHRDALLGLVDYVVHRNA
ncbi:MAG TPA: polyprenyl synthetase family protein [Thermoplasmata archaeon]|jgi:geranylgeranyl pyrophosphate synthase|nr:polyprenyl synthetase family protein [Thermoplasmata archaeon]